MYEALDKEIALYEKRTPKSAAAHKRALERIPLGVASNYRHYEPYPIFVKDGKGSKIHDLDGNEYIDHNLCFGALMAGHCHPAVVKAVEEKASSKARRSACPTIRNGSLPKKSASAIRSRWCASVRAAPK